ncbi:uncharacterized protein SPSK_04498 [Sporothrix schenckii 1099-18]|uniref:Uncharacterized protein n=2 Tax=Sporothrix schenckii TaxID=29908 RepID=U7PVR2_SPOS1|nr:uncharacterized protein SPSK_04498 [Sporothrix schenckii 1099-18]ERS99006.1 hypothetical protein HMPREF1624_04201 [Sporothrix schenckii ATCC 58251]KJR83347.1 hypothetical protein SPSK_04498 [Sporothrix schenckii 1099-18]
MLARKDFRQGIAALLAICIVVFYILVLVGCISTSPGIPGLYVVRLANNASKAEVHVGLFGLCAGTDPVNLTCSGTVAQAIAVNASSPSTKFYLPGTATVAPNALQPLLTLAAGIQSGSTGPGGVLSIVYVPLFLSALCFVGAAGSLLTHRLASRGADSADPADYADEKGFVHTRNAWHAAVLLTTGAIMSALAAAIATTVAVRALLFAGTSLPGSEISNAATAIDVSGGKSIQVLEWLIVVLTMLWHPVLESVWRRIL